MWTNQNAYVLTCHQHVKTMYLMYIIMVNHWSSTAKQNILGVIIDNKLTWHQHIENIKNKINKGLGILKKWVTFCRRKHLSTFLMLF